ncbi:tetratricopeptide repeat protein [Leptolyngbya ohadii]|uniref:tetratricopeptide repeat protein n=1 Tax=Leptolyngbya ohadii TaxID=1962290 RepID=UPI000B5A1EA9|nr:tetratricopeptide repeat protein [Leptolyngbya ohadii]
MEPLPFTLWILVIGFIFAFGVGSMVRAYRGTGSLKLIFVDVIQPTPTPTLNEEAALEFEKGCTAFQEKQYRQAIAHFQQALRLDPTFAEAFHNCGRATANLNQVTEAIGELLKASDRYLEQDNQTGLDRVRQDLETLKTQSQPGANPAG